MILVSNLNVVRDVLRAAIISPSVGAYTGKYQPHPAGDTFV
jgi:hypothetical protein